MQFGIVTLGDNRPDVLTGRLRSAVERHREMVGLAVRAEALDFDSFHVGEHHGCDYITSTPSVVLGALAMRTERIALSTATALLPVHDPIRVAEDYATVDVLSNGRAELVVSRGIIARTYGDLGFDYAQSRGIFKENIELLLRLWREEDVHWKGEHRGPIEGYTAQPRPVQKPPSLWIGGGFSEESILLAAELGLPLVIPSVIQPPPAFVDVIEKYRESFQDRGLGGPRVGAITHVHCARDLDTARERYGRRHIEYMNWVGQQLMPWGLEPVLPSGVAAPQIPPFDFEKMRSEGPIAAGTPQQVLDRLSGFAEAVGLDRFLLHGDTGALPQPEVFESLELLATEVLPHLR